MALTRPSKCTNTVQAYIPANCNFDNKSFGRT